MNSKSICKFSLIACFAPGILSINDLNLSLKNNSFNPLTSKFSLDLIDSISISIGTSFIMVASFLLKIACSLYSIKFCLSLAPFILSIFCKTFSTLPYSLISLYAVFSPMPGTPGILSDVSPIRPLTSINCVGVTP